MNSPDLMRRLEKAEEAFAQKRWQDAVVQLDAISRQVAGIPKVHVLASYAQSYLGRYRDAKAQALIATARPPDSEETLVDVVSRLRTFNAGAELIQYLDKLGAPERLPIPALLASAAQFSYLNLQDRAFRFLSEAERGDPEYPPTLLSLAQVHVYLGNAGKAHDYLRKAQRRAPNIARTYWLLSQLGRRARGDVDDSGQAELVFSKCGSPQDRMELAFALHRFHDDDRQYEKAYAWLDKGLKARREVIQYQSADSRILVDHLKSLPTGASAGTHEASQHKPIFIVGMHRSGTTLLEQLLSANSGVKGIGELYDFTSAMRFETDYHCKGVIHASLVQRAMASPPDYAAVGKRYLDGVGWRLGREHAFTDKLPSNFLNIGFIAQALPAAKILHMVRDPVETCFSNLREWFSDANPYSYDQVELAEYYAMYQELMAHWKERFPGRILDVDYKRLTEETEVVMREVAEFCGLPFETGMLSTSTSKRSVATASAVQVREGVVRRDVPKWAPYEQYLQPMITRLGELGVI